MPDLRIANSLDEEGRELVERLGGRWNRGAGLCHCPGHEDRTPSLSVRVGLTSLLLHCFAGCAAGDILVALRAAGRPLRDGLRASGDHSGGRKSGAALGGAALRVWGAAGPVAGTLAARYLHGRFLEALSPELRFHGRTPHGAAPLTRFRPALIAAVRDSTGLVAIHRTFLDPRGCGLAAIEEPRCGLGRFGAGAVRLGGVARKLGLAEGIETAMSASILFGLPCWATLGTERFHLVAIPADVEELVLFLDNDAGGRRAEALAREAHSRLRIHSEYPREKGADWNDVLRAARAP